MEYTADEIRFLTFCVKEVSCEIGDLQCPYVVPCRDKCDQEGDDRLCNQTLLKIESGGELSKDDIDIIEFFTSDGLWKKNTCKTKDSSEECPNIDECEKCSEDDGVCTILLRKLGRYQPYEYDVYEKEIQKIIVNDLNMSLINWHTDEELKYLEEKPRIDVGEPDILLKGVKSKTLYIVELKVVEASREHVGQLASYVGWYRAHPEQCPEHCIDVKGILLAPKFSKGAEYALKACNDLEKRCFSLHAEIKPVE